MINGFFVGAIATNITPVENNIKSMKSLKDGILSATSSQENSDLSGFDVRKDESTVSITVVGASGDLAKKKIFPALFALYYEDCLPKVCIIELLYSSIPSVCYSVDWHKY